MWSRHLISNTKYIVWWHDDVIEWKHFPRYWPFVRGIHRSPVNSSHKGQWRGALMFSLIWARINGWVNKGEAGELRRYRPHYDVNVMIMFVYAQKQATTGTRFRSSPRLVKHSLSSWEFGQQRLINIPPLANNGKLSNDYKPVMYDITLL